MLLKDLIQWLELQDASAVVRDGFGAPHSDRGDYSDVGFEPAARTTFGEMLRHARSALGRTFTGYKGGKYTMHEYTLCRIGRREESGGVITEAHLRAWRLSAIASPAYERFKDFDRWFESVPEDGEPVLLVARDLWRVVKELACEI